MAIIKARLFVSLTIRSNLKIPHADILGWILSSYQGRMCGVYLAILLRGYQALKDMEARYVD